MLQSGLYYKKLFLAQNLWFINESGFKSRAPYDGAHTVTIQNLTVIAVADKSTLNGSVYFTKPRED